MGLPFHSAVTTARHELEKRFYQIQTEMLILQYKMLGTGVTFCCPGLVREYSFVLFFFLHIWDYFISEMKVPLLFLFFSRLYTKIRILQTFGNQYINSGIPVILCKVSQFWIQDHVCLLFQPL